MENADMNGELITGLLGMGTEPFVSGTISSLSRTSEAALFICASIALYAAIRIILEPDPMRKLPFLNVFSFAITGSMALLIPHPLGIIAAAAYFIGSTFESNAIASTYAGGVSDE
jgi:energy-converting hydrogenase A subunit C